MYLKHTGEDAMVHFVLFRLEEITPMMVAQARPEGEDDDDPCVHLGLSCRPGTSSDTYGSPADLSARAGSYTALGRSFYDRTDAICTAYRDAISSNDTDPESAGAHADMPYQIRPPGATTPKYAHEQQSTMGNVMQENLSHSRTHASVATLAKDTYVKTLHDWFKEHPEDGEITFDGSYLEDGDPVRNVKVTLRRLLLFAVTGVNLTSDGQPIKGIHEQVQHNRDQYYATLTFDFEQRDPKVEPPAFELCMVDLSLGQFHYMKDMVTNFMKVYGDLFVVELYKGKGGRTSSGALKRVISPNDPKEAMMEMAVLFNSWVVANIDCMRQQRSVRIADATTWVPQPWEVIGYIEKRATECRTYRDAMPGFIAMHANTEVPASYRNVDTDHYRAMQEVCRWLPAAAHATNYTDLMADEMVRAAERSALASFLHDEFMFGKATQPGSKVAYAADESMEKCMLAVREILGKTMFPGLAKYLEVLVRLGANGHCCDLFGKPPAKRAESDRPWDPDAPRRSATIKIPLLWAVFYANLRKTKLCELGANPICGGVEVGLDKGYTLSGQRSNPALMSVVADSTAKFQRRGYARMGLQVVKAEDVDSERAADAEDEDTAIPLIHATTESQYQHDRCKWIGSHSTMVDALLYGRWSHGTYTDSEIGPSSIRNACITQAEMKAELRDTYSYDAGDLNALTSRRVLAETLAKERRDNTSRTVLPEPQRTDGKYLVDEVNATADFDHHPFVRCIFEHAAARRPAELNPEESSSAGDSMDDGSSAQPSQTSQASSAQGSYGSAALVHHGAVGDSYGEIP